MNGKIFIIEDEPSIIQLVQHNLEKNGFLVSSSLNGNDGLKELKKFQPDLLLLDWMLPDLSGIEICKNIRKDNSFKNLPVIMLTAKGEEEDVAVLAQCGVATSLDCISLFLILFYICSFSFFHIFVFFCRCSYFCSSGFSFFLVIYCPLFSIR